VSCPLQLLVKWWSEYAGELLLTRVVSPIQSYLTKELMATKKLTISVMNAIKVGGVGGCVGGWAGQGREEGRMPGERHRRKGKGGEGREREGKGWEGKAR
jgi:hypothetical protein